MKYLVRSAVLAATLLTTSTAFAHRSWMIPSATVLAGDDAWVCIDGARSNTLFHADHNALRTENAVAIAPDGSRVKPENMMRARYRS
ncbi:MAG TPA: hypothetical protein VNR40_10795, partial [Steroidobacter sp.]|nr:hypothetical protein [Steroidobacter sp.]